MNLKKCAYSATQCTFSNIFGCSNYKFVFRWIARSIFLPLDSRWLPKSDARMYFCRNIKTIPISYSNLVILYNSIYILHSNSKWPPLPRLKIHVLLILSTTINNTCLLERLCQWNQNILCYMYFNSWTYFWAFLLEKRLRLDVPDALTH